MLFLIFFLILLISIALVGVLTSGFFSFHQNFGEITEYNQAYYAAISALERGELVLKYRKPGFEGTGGRLDSLTGGAKSDYTNKVGYFKNLKESGMLWNIRSRTTKIPKNGEGNVDRMLVTGDAMNYNVLDYHLTEQFVLDVDQGVAENSYKDTVDAELKKTATNFTGIIRLPKYLENKLGEIAIEEYDIGEDGILDDQLLERELNGVRNGKEFTVYPTMDLKYNNKKIEAINPTDTMPRESKIGNVMTFFKNKNPYSTTTNTTEKQTVISDFSNELETKTFWSIIKEAKGVSFKLSLLNLVYAKTNQIYPYLEYQFSFKNDAGVTTNISDRFYTITAMGKSHTYEVKLMLRKPTVKQSILGSFTVIF